MNPRHWNLLILSVLLAGSLWIAANRVRPEQSIARSNPQPAIAADPAPQENYPAPDFSLNDLHGTPTRLAELRGQVVLINVWASWCPPCRAEMPMIQASYTAYRDQGFIVLGINLHEDQQTVTDFMQQNKLSFPTLLDQDGNVAAIYQARALPSSFFIDKAGVIRAVYRGPMTRSVIEGTVTQLLAE